MLDYFLNFQNTRRTLIAIEQHFADMKSKNLIHFMHPGDGNFLSWLK